MRLGILGGTFDPVHYGHLLLAEYAREQCELDQVRFVPAACAPHKTQNTITPAQMRLEMLNLAISGQEAYAVSTLEIDRGGISYTVDTLEEIHRELPGAEVFLIVGADSLSELPTWREPQRICELATPVVVRRYGAPEPDFEILDSYVDSDRLEQMRVGDGAQLFR